MDFQDGPWSLDFVKYVVAVVTAVSTKPASQCMNLYSNFLGEQSQYQSLCMATIYLHLSTAQSQTRTTMQPGVCLPRLYSLLAGLLAGG
jgi:hypothetical protein